VTITATRLRRLELWSALQCAGGRRLAIWPQVIAATTSALLGVDSSLTAQVPLDAEASTALAQWTVVRVWEDDTRWDEWVVTTVTRDDPSAVLTFSAAWPHVVLGRAGVVDERTPDGRVRLQLDRVGQTPAQLIDTLVVAPLAALGLPWVSRGDVPSTVVRDVSLSANTPLQALELIAAPDQEIAFRRVGVTGYAIDVVERVGAGGPVLDLRSARNLLTFQQDETLSEHATVITAQGAELDGEAGTIADAVWRVTAVDGSLVTLADPDGGPGPIAYDAQLDSLQLERANGGTVPIIASTFGTQQVECGLTPALSVGALVRVVAADASDLVALPCPPAVREYGRIAGTIARPDIPGHRNLVPNSVLRAWPGDGTSAPDGWSAVGAVTLSRLTAGPQIRRGVSALQLVTAGAGTGVASPSAAITTTPDRPFVSGYVTLWVVAGQVRVELVATTSSGTRVYPLGGALATNSELDVPTDLGLAGIDAHAAGITHAVLRVVQHSATPATVILESAQLTRSASQLPFVEGAGGNLLWHATNQALGTAAVPRLRSRVSLVDLAALDPVRYGADCTITLGAKARVVLPRRGIDGLARIVQVDRNVLRTGDASITLSDKPEDLSGSLARVTWRPRPIPTPTLVLLAGDVTATTAFDGSGLLSILVQGPVGADSLRAAVSTSGMPSAAAVDAASGTLRVDGTDVATLTAAGPFAPGQLVYIAVRAYRAGVGSRVVQLTDAADAADASQGPSLEVRTTQSDEQLTVAWAAIGTVTYRVGDVITTTPVSPFAITRPAELALEVRASLTVVRNGLTVTEPIIVLPRGVDTVTPDHSVVPDSAGQLRDTVAFSYFGSDPSGRALPVTRTLTLVGCTAVGLSGAGPHVLTQGQRVEIVKPLARNGGTAMFATQLTGGGRVEQSRSIPPRDLTGAGVEVLSNPEFRADLPRRELPYDNSTGLITLSYAAVSGQNTSGVELVISKAAGVTAPGSGGFTLFLLPTAAATFAADAYREGALYLLTLRAIIPSGYSIIYASNAYGVGGSAEWLSSQAGTGAYADYVLRLQIGTGGTLSSIGFFWLTNGVDTAPVVWRVPRLNWRDLTASERQPVASLSVTRVGGDATTDIVQPLITPASADSQVWIVASSDTPIAGAAPFVGAPNGSLWTLPRRAFRTGTGQAFFRGRTPGFELAEASIVIPEQGRDTVPLTMSVAKVGGSTTTDVLRVTATDPFPQGAGTLTLAILGGGAASLSPAGPLAITSGSPVDITVGKPTSTAQDAVVGFTASNAHRVSAFREITVAAVRALIPARVEIVSVVQDGVNVITRFRVVYADGAEATTTDIALLDFRDERTPVGGGAPVLVSRSVSRDAVNGWYSATSPRVAGDAMRAIVLVAAVGITARTEVTFALPPLPALAPEPEPGPRFTSVSVTAPSAPGTQVLLAWTVADMPSGVTYAAQVTTRDVPRTLAGLATPAQIAIGRSAPDVDYPQLFRVTGWVLALLDGNVVAQSLIPETTYYSTVSET
jgi:hypothetical protein